MEKSVILEFYGMPGSGKSTISHALANELNNKKFNLIETSYVLDHHHSKKRRQLIKARKSLLWSMRHFFRLIKLVRIVMNCESKEVMSDIINLTYKAYEIEHADAQIMIFDEGLLQASISLTYSSGYDSAVVYQRIQECLCFKHNTISIYVKDSIDNCLEKQKLRGTFDSRVDRELDINRKNRMMNQFEHVCDMIKADIVLNVSYGEIKSQVQELLESLNNLGIDNSDFPCVCR